MSATQSTHGSGVSLNRDEGRPSIRLSLLKGFQLFCDQRSVGLPFSAQRLVAFLGLQERPIQRDNVASALWNDSSEEHAAANLRSALWRLRRPGLEIVDVDGRRLQLSRFVVVDVREMTAIARRVINPSDDLDLGGIDAIALEGDVLPDWYEDWVMLERERFRQMRLHALEAMCERFTLAGRHAQAVEAGLTAVRGEPLRESANRCLISALLAQGNRLEARRHLERFKELVRSELGVAVSAQMLALEAALFPSA